MTALQVIRPGLFSTIQDGGRWGYEQWGVMVGGAVDEEGLRWANWLVGNPPSAGALEVTALGPELVVAEPGLIGIAGADLDMRVDGVRWNPGHSGWVERGARIAFGRRLRGLRAYLSLPGGIAGERVLGSVATDVLAGIGGMGGRAMQSGDQIVSPGPGRQSRQAACPTLRVGRTVRVVPGVRRDRFPPAAWAELLTRTFSVSGESNRMGLRLLGEPVSAPDGDWPSEGMAIGSVECPPGGRLLVLLNARGSLGGYPALAHVIRADWPILAQLVPGDALTFAEVTWRDAQEALRRRDQILLGAGPEWSVTLKAPVAGVAEDLDEYDRPLPVAGDWVFQGQLIRRVWSLGVGLNLRAPTDGWIVSVADGGDGVACGDPVAVLKGWGPDAVRD